MKKYFAIRSIFSIILTLVIVYAHIIENVSYIVDYSNQDGEIKISNSKFFLYCIEDINNQKSEQYLEIGMYCKNASDSIFFNNIDILLISNFDTLRYNSINIGNHSGDLARNFKDIPDKNKFIIPGELNWTSFVFTFEKYKPKELQELSILIDYSYNNSKKTLHKKLLLRRFSNLEFRALDHSGLSIILIPSLVLYSIIYTLFWYVVRRKELKSNKS